MLNWYYFAMLHKFQDIPHQKALNVDSATEEIPRNDSYKEHYSPGRFLSDPNNIPFLGNTDGVALIKSTSYGVWPVYLIHSEIPPTKRFAPDYTSKNYGYICTDRMC